MDAWFTPQFFAQLIFAAFSAGGVYVGVRMDLKHMHEKIDEEKRLREIHSTEDDQHFDAVQGRITEVSNRIANVEGRLSLHHGSMK